MIVSADEQCNATVGFVLLSQEVLAAGLNFFLRQALFRWGREGVVIFSVPRGVFMSLGVYSVCCVHRGL